MTMPLPAPNLKPLGLKLVLLVVLKVLFLTVLWYVAIRPHPRPDTSPNALEQQLGPHSSSPDIEAKS
jgi:hypothetical protein